MLGSLKKAANFYYTYFFFLVFAVVSYLYQGHGDFVLALNGLHNVVFNYFFRFWTYGGDAVLFAIIAVWLLFTKRNYGYIYLLIGLLQGTISFLMKQVIFGGSPRPKVYFEDRQVLDFIEGVDVLSYNSFPSGHTMTAFSIACFLALVLQSKRWSFLLAIGAVLVGISRVYLLQHFLIDIIAGSLIGVIISTTIFIFFERFLLKKKYKKEEVELESDDDYSDIDLQ
jgi:membrane-associated phospholipid phosphatase